MSRNKSPQSNKPAAQSTGTPEMNDLKDTPVAAQSDIAETTATTTSAAGLTAEEVEALAAVSIEGTADVAGQSDDADINAIAAAILGDAITAAAEVAGQTVEPSLGAIEPAVAGDTNIGLESNFLAEDETPVLDADRGVAKSITHIDEASFVKVDTVVAVPNFLVAQRARLESYGRAMGGEILISPKEQLDQQNIFRLVIESLLKLRGADFGLALDELLIFIRANRGYAFKEKYVFREYPNLPISADARRLLVDVVTLLMAIAEPGTRAMVGNQIDISSVLKGLVGFDEVRNLFHEFITR